MPGGSTRSLSEHDMEAMRQNTQSKEEEESFGPGSSKQTEKCDDRTLKLLDGYICI